MDWYLLVVFLITFVFGYLPFFYVFSGWNFFFKYVPLFLIYWIFFFPPEWKPFKHNRFTRWLRESYFDVKIHDPFKTLNDGKRTIFIVHPHGVYAVSLFIGFLFDPEKTNIKVAISSLLFRTPIVKDIVSLWGCISVKEKDLLNLDPEMSIAMCPGGLRELLNNNGKYVKRPGFLRIARKRGARIVLVQCPAELSLYNLFIPKFMYPIQNFLLKELLYPCFIFSWGNILLPFWPKRKSLELYFSEPIEIESNYAPDVKLVRIYGSDPLEI